MERSAAPYAKGDMGYMATGPAHPDGSQVIFDPRLAVDVDPASTAPTEVMAEPDNEASVEEAA